MNSSKSNGKCLKSVCLLFIFILSMVSIFLVACSPKEIPKEMELEVINGTQDIVVEENIETVTLNGSINSNASISLNIADSKKPLTIYLNNLNVTGVDGSSLISCSGSREIHIISSGSNSLKGIYAVAISCPSSDIYFEGDGLLSIFGGNGQMGVDGEDNGASGKNGGDGFEAIIASKIYVNMNSMLTLIGGHGGNGGRGAWGTSGTNGKDVPLEALGNTQVGGAGGNAGNGGNGGKGADAVRATLLNATSGKVILQGGDGGNGADGGNGGKGGRGGKNGLLNYKGGWAGSGGNGGNGGDAAYGGNINLEDTVNITSAGIAQIEILVGKNGIAGNGGNGGEIGDDSGDKHGDIVPSEDKAPHPGSDGQKGKDITVQ